MTCKIKTSFFYYWIWQTLSNCCNIFSVNCYFCSYLSLAYNTQINDPTLRSVDQLPSKQAGPLDFFLALSLGQRAHYLRIAQKVLIYQTLEAFSLGSQSLGSSSHGGQYFETLLQINSSWSLLHARTDLPWQASLSYLWAVPLGEWGRGDISSGAFCSNSYLLCMKAFQNENQNTEKW